MKKSIILILSMMLLLTACTDNSTEKTEDTSAKQNTEEAKKEETTKDEEKGEQKRVIAGTVMSAELLDILDIDAVGVPTTEKEMPERYKDVEKIGMSMKPDIEKVVSLNPDVFISDITLKESVDKLLEGQDIEIIYLQNNSYEDVKKTITELGEYFNKEQQSKEVVKKMQDTEEKVLAEIKDKENPRVMVLFGTTESFMLATKNSFVGSLIEKLGATNVTDDVSKGAPTPYVPFSLEQAVSLNPDVVLRLTHMDVEASKAAFEQEFSKGLWQNMKPVQEEKVYDLDPEYFGVTANSRASESLEKLAEILYE